MNPPYVPVHELLSQPVCSLPSKTLQEILSKTVNKQHWAAEFETVPSTYQLFHTKTDGSKMIVTALEQHYFRNWNYVTPLALL